MAIFLVTRLFLLEKRDPMSDGMSHLVVALLALMLLQSFNPMVGNITAGAGGFMFLGVPLLWFFIGREIADRRLVTSTSTASSCSPWAIGAYGLLQTEVGLPSWDNAWVDAERLPGAQRVRGARGGSAPFPAPRSTGSS